jgi:hypothetical protein
MLLPIFVGTSTERDEPAKEPSKTGVPAKNRSYPRPRPKGNKNEQMHVRARELATPEEGCYSLFVINQHIL